MILLHGTRVLAVYNHYNYVSWVQSNRNFTVLAPMRLNRTEQNRTTISVGHIILPTYNEQNENIQQEKVILFKLKCMNNRYYGQFICEIFGKGVISL